MQISAPPGSISKELLDDGDDDDDGAEMCRTSCQRRFYGLIPGPITGATFFISTAIQAKERKRRRIHPPSPEALNSAEVLGAHLPTYLTSPVSQESLLGWEGFVNSLISLCLSLAGEEGFSEIFSGRLGFLCCLRQRRRRRDWITR